MDALITDFARALNAQDGYALSATLSPEPPKHDSGRLYALRQATNAYSVLADFRYAIGQNPNLELDRQEKKAWIDVYVAYWKAISDMLAAQDSTTLSNSNGNSDGGTNNSFKTAAHWDRVYEAWRDVVNALYKGYQNGSFEAWTIPCLYVAGKYLRVFAIKADDKNAIHKGGASFNDALEDDVVDQDGGDEKLEDCARQINRVFGLCISDRAPIQESRKWGLYYTTNLLFRTYFKARTPPSVSDSPFPR